MDHAPPPNSLPQRTVRKAAFGRTNLFLPTQTALQKEVKCMGGVVQRDTASVFHLLPAAHEVDGVCWHCCEPVARGAGLPLPRLFDTDENVYHVYGVTCGPPCAKAYILEHTTFDRGQHLNVLVSMLRDVYQHTAPVVEAPPRPALRRFGGPFDPASLPKVSCRLVAPPFVSYCMLAEEHVGAPEDLPAAPPAPPAPITDLEEEFADPAPDSLYAEFLQNPPPPPPPSSRRKRPAKGGGAAAAPPHNPFFRELRTNGPSV